MLTPDYDNSIVNLISSLAGDQAPAPELYPPLKQLEQARIDQRPVALLVVDGLGDQFLQRFPDSTLAQYRLGSLTSVFPTTTATAVTALALGVPAQQHAITGWFTYFRELGSVAMPLPFVPRGGGQCYSELGISAAQMLDAQPLLPRFNRPVRVTSPAYIADSEFSRALYGKVKRSPYQSLLQFFDCLSRGLKRHSTPLMWGYWTELDALAHQYGVFSREAVAHFYELDQLFAQWLETIAGLDALVLVTADHGLIDVDPEQQLLLDQHPELQSLLRLPLCGEPRAAFAYLKPGAERAFCDYLDQYFPGLFELYPSQQLLDQGWFGRGVASSRLVDRIGDLCVLARQQAIISDRLIQERPFSQKAVHGGLSAQELDVPLVMIEP